MTKNRLEYALLLLALGVFHVFLVNYLSFFVLAFFLILPLLSLVSALLASRGLTVRLAVKKEYLSKNEALPILLTVKTGAKFLTSRVRVKIAVRNELMPEVQAESLMYLSAGKSEQTVQQTLSSDYCGKLTCWIQELRVSDYLGLFSFRRRTGDGQEHPVFVYPVSYPLKGIGDGSVIPKGFASDDATHGKIGDDPAEIVDIREYRSGDRLSRIHWKISGKYENVMVKDFGQPASSDVLLLFDLNGTGRELDGLMDTLRSISCFLLEHQRNHDMEWYDSLSGLFTRTGIAQEEELRAVLATLLSADRRQKRPAALLNYASADAPDRYAEIIYIGSPAGLTPEVLMSFRDRLAEGQIRILIVAEKGVQPVPMQRVDAARAAEMGLNLTVIDAGNIKNSLGQLVVP